MTKAEKAAAKERTAARKARRQEALSEGYVGFVTSLADTIRKATNSYMANGGSVPELGGWMEIEGRVPDPEAEGGFRVVAVQVPCEGSWTEHLAILRNKLNGRPLAS